MEEQREHQRRMLRRQIDNSSSPDSFVQPAVTSSLPETVTDTSYESWHGIDWPVPSTTSRTTSQTILWQSYWTRSWMAPSTTSTRRTSSMTTTPTSTPITPYVPHSSRISDTLSSVMLDSSLTRSPLSASASNTYSLNPSTAIRIPLSDHSDVRTAPMVSPSGSTGLGASNAGSLTSFYFILYTTHTVVGSNGEVVTSVEKITSTFPASRILAEPSSVEPTPTITPDTQQPD